MEILSKWLRTQSCEQHIWQGKMEPFACCDVVWKHGYFTVHKLSVVHEYHSFSLPIQYPYLRILILRATHVQHVSWLQLLYQKLTNFIGSSYMSDFLHKNITLVQLYMGAYVFLYIVYWKRTNEDWLDFELFSWILMGELSDV